MNTLSKYTSNTINDIFAPLRKDKKNYEKWLDQVCDILDEAAEAGC